MAQCFPVKNLRRPPDWGGSATLSGVPTNTQVPIRSLASLVGSAPLLCGWSPAPTRSTTADTRRTAATGMARRFVDLSIGEAPVCGVTQRNSPPPPNRDWHACHHVRKPRPRQEKTRRAYVAWARRSLRPPQALGASEVRAFLASLAGQPGQLPAPEPAYRRRGLPLPSSRRRQHSGPSLRGLFTRRLTARASIPSAG